LQKTPDPLGAAVGAGPDPDGKQPHSPGNSRATVLSASSKDRPLPGLFQFIRYSARSPQVLHPFQASQATVCAQPPTHPQEW